MAANGSQGVADDVRMDCSAETAMALAMRAAAEAARGGGSGADFAAAASSLLNFTWLYSNAAQAHNNETDASFGILEWGVS
jgi:hypothetical protein